MNEMEVIKEINAKMDYFTKKIRNEHHKGRDGVWGMNYDIWENAWTVFHCGYWLADIDVVNPNLLCALEDFLEEVSERINEEIEAYDFENHCAKE